MKKFTEFGVLLVACLIAACGHPSAPPPQAKETSSTASSTNMTIEKITRTDDEWQKQLTPEQYRVTRKHGTERAFSGQYWNNHESGTYYCVAGGLELFGRETKFEKK